jgi:uncharacterized protein (DUF2141 family)
VRTGRAGRAAFRAARRCFVANHKPPRRSGATVAPLIHSREILMNLRCFSQAGAALALVALSAPTLAAELTVVVSGIRDGDGQLMVGVFDKADTFLKQPLQGRVMPASVRDGAGNARIVIDNLAPGGYAVSVVHDRDGNGRLTMNLMGLPSEPFGFSGKGGNFGPPKFEDASLQLDTAGATVDIQLK